MAYKKQHQRFAEFLDCSVAHAQERDINAIIRFILLTQKATMCRNVMILLADWFIKTVHFNIDGLLSERLGRYPMTLMGMQRVNETDKKAGRRAKAGPR